MEFVYLTQLWLPILLSAVAVFVVSSIIHMALPYHRGDYKKLPDEEAFLNAVRGMNLPVGSYHFPRCESQKEMKSPEYIEKLNKGPIGLMTIIPSGQPRMGKYLTCWVLYTVAVGVFVAYIAGRTLKPGAEYLEVFRIAGTVAFVCYAMAHTHNSIWKGEAWSTTFKFYIDGLIYGLLTAGIFASMWPKA
jgi:hypothetical protein